MSQLLHVKFRPSHRCNVWPLRGEKPQNRPMSDSNTAASTSRYAGGNKRFFWRSQNMTYSVCNGTALCTSLVNRTHWTIFVRY